MYCLCGTVSVSMTINSHHSHCIPLARPKTSTDYYTFYLTFISLVDCTRLFPTSKFNLMCHSSGRVFKIKLKKEFNFYATSNDLN